MVNDQRSNRKKGFLNQIKIKPEKVKGIVAVGIVTVGMAGVVKAAAEGYYADKMDLSNSNINNTEYLDDIIDNHENPEILSLKIWRMTQLEENIRIYKSLSEAKDLDPTQAQRLEQATNDIKIEMSNRLLFNIYLEDIFKAKVKECYNVDDVVLDGDGDKAIKLYKGNRYKNDKFSSPDIWISEYDTSNEIRTVMRDIVLAQYYAENKSNYDKDDVESFIKIFENMKAFSCLKIGEVKEGIFGDYKLSTIGYEESLDPEEISQYNITVSDNGEIVKFEPIKENENIKQDDGEER